MFETQVVNRFCAVQPQGFAIKLSTFTIFLIRERQSYGKLRFVRRHRFCVSSICSEWQFINSGEVGSVTEIRDIEPLSRGILYQYAYFATLTLAGAAFYIYVIHVFPSSIVGSVALLIAILSLFPMLFSFGLQYGWQHFTSYEIGSGTMSNIRTLFRRAVRAGLLLSALSVLALFILAKPITFLFFHSYSYLPLVYLLALDIPSSIMISFLNSIMLGLQNFRMAGIIGMTYVMTVYGTSIAVLDATHLVYSIPIGWGVGYFVGALLYYFDLRRRIRTESVSAAVPEEGMKPVITYSLPMYVTGILSYGAVYFDRLTVALLKDLSSIGVYNLALLISSGTSILSSPIGSVIFSKFSEFHAKRDSEMIREGVRIATNAASILYVPAALGMAAISVPVITLFAGTGYLAGAFPLSIILVVNALFVFGGPLGNAMQGTRRTFVFILATAVALLSNIVLSFTLIPSLSLVGAAIAYSSTTVFSTLVILVFARNARLVRLDRRFLPRLWFSAVSMALIVYGIELLLHFRLLFLPVYIIAGILSFIALLHLTSALSEEDRKFLSSFVPGRFRRIRKLIMAL